MLLLDLAFTLFHSALTLFNLTGWIWKRTRKLHLITIGLTLFSWVALGFFYGWGYCFLTDWHYLVLENLGYENLPSSYITFMIERVTGYRPDKVLVNVLTVAIFALVLVIAVGLQIRDRRTARG